MTPHQWFLLACAAFGTIVAVGFGVSLFFYYRLGYPSTPRFMKGIMLRDDIETIWKKVEVATQEGFHVTERNDHHLVLEKTYDDPPSVMTIEFLRPPGYWSFQSTSVTVTCLNHPWLNFGSHLSANCVRWSKKPT